MIRLTAEEIYKKLTTEENIIGKIGHIEFTLNDVSVRINSKDTVGNLLQEWLKQWFKTNNIVHCENENRQKFPDFYLNLEDRKKDLLEVKTFDFDKSPNFDIANFDAYCNSLLTDAYRLDSKYLIFGYSMCEEGNITISNVWLKNIWEIAGNSGTYPLRVQEKKQIIYNIRPVIWYSDRATFKPFNSKEEFLQALNETRYQYANTRASNNHWLQNVLKNYKEQTGVDLIVPR